MLPTVTTQDGDWLTTALEAIRLVGCVVVGGVLDVDVLARTRSAMYSAQEAIVREVGADRLERAGELGVLRLMMKFEPFLLTYLEIPHVLQVVDRTVSETAVLHLQNGFILPSFPAERAPEVFQTSFHQDFPRVLNGFLASVNVFFAIDEFSAVNGATLVVPGTHQRVTPPDSGYLRRNALPVVCPAGSMLLFDSTLWHAAGINTSGQDRLAINHQFTRSYFKQQIDYVRALGDDILVTLPPRTQQLLGWYTRVVTSLDEYYQPEAARLYRRGQG
jgi:ectoine hydroxylase-related dioxygenase (phytanoyl-CoA dioxygenase family)